MRNRYTAALGLFTWVLGANAWAQPSPQDMAMAESLFQKGIAAMDAGNFSEGCPLIAESQRLDPLNGTLIALADCEDRWGHVATAFGLYENYLNNVDAMPPEQKKKHAARAKKAAERKKALEPLVPGMVIVLPPNLPPDTKLWRDGRALDLSAAALEIPIDPGEHRLMLQLPNGASTEKHVKINPGEHLRVELAFPALENKTPPPVQSPFLPAPPPLLPALSLSPAPLKDASHSSPADANPYRTWAYVSGGIGLAGLALGGVLGGIVLKEKAVWTDHCDETTKKCEREGIEARERALPFATGSTVGFVVGGVGLAAGALLLVLSLRDGKNTKSSSEQGGISVGILDLGQKGMVLGAAGRL